MSRSEKFFTAASTKLRKEGDYRPLFDEVVEQTNGVGISLLGQPSFSGYSPSMTVKDVEGIDNYRGGEELNYEFDGSPCEPYLRKYAKKWSTPVIPLADPHPWVTLDNWGSVREDLKRITDSIIDKYAALGLGKVASFNEEQRRKLTLERGFWPGAFLGYPMSTNVDSDYRGSGADQFIRLESTIRHRHEVMKGALRWVMSTGGPVKHRFSELIKFGKKGWDTSKDWYLPQTSKVNMHAQTWLPTCSSDPRGRAAHFGMATLALRDNFLDAGEAIEEMITEYCGLPADLLNMNARYQEGGDRPMPFIAGTTRNPKIIGVHSNVYPRVRSVMIPPFCASVLMSPEVTLMGWLRTAILPLFMAKATLSDINSVFSQACSKIGMRHKKVKSVNREFWSLGGTWSHVDAQHYLDKLKSISKLSGQKGIDTFAVDVSKFDSRNFTETLRGVRLMRFKTFCDVTGAPFDERHVPTIEQYRPVAPMYFMNPTGRLVIGKRDGVLESGAQDTADLAKDVNEAGSARTLQLAYGIHLNESLAGVKCMIENQGDDQRVSFPKGLIKDNLTSYLNIKREKFNLVDEIDSFNTFLRDIVEPDANFRTSCATRAVVRMATRDFGKLRAPYIAVTLLGLHSSLSKVNPLSVREYACQEAIEHIQRFADREDFLDGPASVSRSMFDWNGQYWDRLSEWMSTKAPTDVFLELRENGSTGTQMMHDHVARMEGPLREAVLGKFNNAEMADVMERMSTADLWAQHKINPLWYPEGDSIGIADWRAFDNEAAQTKAEVDELVDLAQNLSAYLSGT